MNPHIWIWVAALVLFVILEATTAQLVSIWFAAGALATLIVTLFDVSFGVQVAVFVVASAALVLLTRPLARRIVSTRHTRTNADRVIGEVAMVTEAIDNIAGKGQVTVMGQVWSARSTGMNIPSGRAVTVLAIEGVKLTVELREESAWVTSSEA